MMLLNILEINIKIFPFLMFFIKIIYAQTLQNLKVFYLSNNKYYIITYDKIIFYDHGSNLEATPVSSFEGNTITTAEDFEKINMAQYKNR